MSVVDTERSDARDAAAGGVTKRRYVRRMFSEIAPRYDFLNHLLSFNIDRSWRRRAIAALRWERRPRGTYVDLCAGTMDLSVALARAGGFHGRVIAIDFAEPMLRAGRAKAGGARVHPVVGDALELPLADASVDGVIVGFGVRNLDDLDAGFRELRRVLAPGARLVILECSTPPSALVRGAYRAYFHRVLPVIGRFVSGHPTAYRYLPESVSNFPDAPELADRMRHAGLASVGYQSLTLGVSALHWGEG